MEKRTLRSMAVTFFGVTFFSLFSVIAFHGVAGAREPYPIKIFTIRAGTSSYIQAVALQDIINKNSTWVKASVVEGKAPGYNLKRVVSDPKLRKTTIFHLPGTTHWEALERLPLFADVDYDFNRIRYLLPVGFIAVAMISLDPKIATLADLKGKTIIIGPRPARDSWQDFAFAMIEAAGVSRDDVKREYMSYTPAHNALKDGLVDAVGTGASLFEMPNKWVLSPFAIEVVNTRKVSFMSMDAKIMDKIRNETGNPYYPNVIPANSFKNQNEPWVVGTKYVKWAATDELPDDVVAEVLRIAYENANVFGEYTKAGKIISEQTMGMMGEKLQYYHPIAKKLCEEKGVPMGIIK